MKLSYLLPKYTALHLRRPNVKMEATCCSENIRTYYETTRRHIPEIHNLCNVKMDRAGSSETFVRITKLYGVTSQNVGEVGYFEKFLSISRLYGVTSQKTVIFISTAVRTSSLSG
jgi:hypothetical protein